MNAFVNVYVSADYRGFGATNFEKHVVLSEPNSGDPHVTNHGV